MRKNLIILVEGALIAAVCMALTLIPIQTPNASFDLSLGLIPLCVYAARRGAIPAMAVGMVWGLLHPLLGRAYILTIPQFIVEYPVAFAFAGLFGLYAKRIRGIVRSNPKGMSAVGWICAASVTAAAARWVWHFLAGATAWATYAPEGMNPWFYSFLFNGASFLANSIMLIIVMTALIKTAPRLIFVDNSPNGGI